MESEQETKINSTPKLSLFSLPAQPPEPLGMLTPPLQTLASVPFQWEEAPGKPRSYSIVDGGDGGGAATGPPSKPKAARCLDLPPRLLNEGLITKTPSPTTVLDGPYSGRSLAHTMSFSLGKGTSFRSPEGGGVVKGQISKEKWNFSSWRWGSFKEDDGVSEGVFDFSPSIGGDLRPDLGDMSEVKVTRMKKRKSFFNSSKSHFWVSIYQSVKQAVPWRRKQEKLRRTDP